VRDLHVDVRVIVATNQDLEELVRQRRFREDLFYRINVIPIVLPPLRHRAQDIPPLAQVLLARACDGASKPRRRLSPALGERLKAYDWPGNIRELEHALRHALAMGRGEEIAAEDFPSPVRAAISRFEAPAAEAQDSTAAPPAESEIVVIDHSALRRAIRNADAIALGSSDRPYNCPAHVAHARRAYLAALIEELGGDLSLIGLFWDRGSEKTLRRIVREMGLEPLLASARRRRRGRRGRRRRERQQGQGQPFPGDS
jgi:DNA-binding NtrC family response regulator